MISKTLQKALNKQIEMEAQASHIYLAMASWCDKSALPGCAKFLYLQSEEERQHMLKLFNYVNETGGFAHTPKMEQPELEYKSIETILEEVLSHEKKVTKSINELVDQCLAEKDYSTFNFLQWYVAEQHEEEHLFKGLIDKVKLIGNDKKSLYWIDKELAGFSKTTGK